MKKEKSDLFELIKNPTVENDNCHTAHLSGMLRPFDKCGFDMSHPDSGRFLNAILETTQDGFIVIFPDGSIIYANESYLKMTGYSKGDLETLKLRDMIPADKKEAIRQARKTILEKGAALFESVDRMKDGRLRHVEVSAAVLCRDPLITVCFIRDITDRKNAEQALYHEKEHFKMTLLSVGDGVISADSRGRVTVMNPIAEKLTGWTNREAAGKPLENVLTVMYEDTRKPNADYLKKVILAGSIVELSNSLLLVSKDGREIPVELGAAPIKNSAGEIIGAVVVIRDYSEKKTKQKQIEYLSYHDALTGLYNRRYVEDSIRRLDTARNLPLTLMIIDVNGLNLTNNAFGYEAGDRLLQKVAEMISRVCRADDIIGRIGGDEFCILLPRTDEKQAEAINNRIKNAASKLKLDPIILSLAVGHAAKTSPEQDVKTVMTAAENLMYKDKIKHGKAMQSQMIEMVLHHINLNYAQEQLHTQKVSQYCEAIAKVMGLNSEEIGDIKNAAALHDIGKIMVPPQILNKPGKLTRAEFSIIKRHPEIGYQMLKSVDEYMMLADYVLHHHERWDGTGYPEGLRGVDIPLYSRIIAVADAYEAMTALRPYQKSKTKEEAVAELIRCADMQFDAEIVSVFVDKILQQSAIKKVAD